MSAAIRAASNSVLGVIQRALEDDPLTNFRFDAGLGGLMRVSLRTPQEMVEQSTDGLSVFLYHICVDEQSRNRPPERLTRDRLRPPPLPLRLRFLFTPVVRTLDQDTGPEVEQEIIGKVIETWYSHPFIFGADLADELAGTGARFSIRIEPLDLESISRVWDALEESFQLSISYELTLVEIESRLAPTIVEPVQNLSVAAGPLVEEARP